MKMRNLVGAFVFALGLAMPGVAMFALVPADRVDEVPIDRLLANLQHNTQGLSEAQKWRAIAA